MSGKYGKHILSDNGATSVVPFQQKEVSVVNVVANFLPILQEPRQFFFWQNMQAYFSFNVKL